jgi:hypothetical protein
VGSNTLGCNKLYAPYPAGGASSRYHACLIGEGGSVGLATRGRTEKYSTCCVTFAVNVGAACYSRISAGLHVRVTSKVTRDRWPPCEFCRARLSWPECPVIAATAAARSARLTFSNDESMSTSLYSPSLSVSRMFRVSLYAMRLHYQRSVRLSAIEDHFLGIRVAAMSSAR